MKIIRTYPTTIKPLAEYPLKDDMPWCDLHEDSYATCVCPKEGDTPETGWFVEKQSDGAVLAFPTEETFNNLALWVNKNGDEMVCDRCKATMQIDTTHGAQDTEDTVYAFYEIHEKCS